MESKITKRLINEYKNLTLHQICGVKVIQEEGNLYKWKVDLQGPKGSPYEDGIFNLSFDLTNYPFRCPEVKFITPMYHPNIKKDTGEICMDLFANDWAPTQKVYDIILKIASLLVNPLIESPLEPEIAQEYASDYKNWEKNVREFVKTGVIIKKNNINQEIKDEKDEKKMLYAENEYEEEVQIYVAKERSEEDSKKILDKKKEEKRNFIMAVKNSQKEKFLKKININNIETINPIFEEKFDEEFGICPITQDYMENPVLCPSGYYFEKEAIINWIKRNHNDPFTREYLHEDMLIEDNEFKNLIIEYRKKFNK